MKSKITEEYQRAINEKRQPNCPYCDQPLEVRQIQYTDIKWEWDKKEGCYIKNDDSGDADRPFCVNCDMKSWDFVDNGKETTELGLDF